VRSAHAGIDADILIKVQTFPVGWWLCQDGFKASGHPEILEDKHFRPIYGIIQACRISPSDFEGDLALYTHEILTILVRHHSSFHGEGDPQVARCNMVVPHSKWGSKQQCANTQLTGN
jgi:hypothetical protein